MPADLTKPGVYFEIWHTIDGSDIEWVPLCECESPQAAGAIVIALLSAERKRPWQLRIVPRVEVPS